jgi:sugar/nucleoside kinase (ribokinase family)
MLEHFRNVSLPPIILQSENKENSRNYPFNKGREFSMTYRNPEGEQPQANAPDENAMGKSSRDAVTPAMVEAASAVLRESGLLEYFPEGPAQEVVRKMLEAANEIPEQQSDLQPIVNQSDPVPADLRGLLEAFDYDPDQPASERASERERDLERELHDHDREREEGDLE